MAYEGRGRAFFKNGKAERAVEDFTHAIQLAPCDPIAYISRGNALRARREWDAAAQDFRKAIQLRSLYSRPFPFFGDGTGRDGKSGEALSASAGRTARNGGVAGQSGLCSCHSSRSQIPQWRRGRRDGSEGHRARVSQWKPTSSGKDSRAGWIVRAEIALPSPTTLKLPNISGEATTLSLSSRILRHTSHI